jgi:predicted ribonuclease YlaK
LIGAEVDSCAARLGFLADEFQLARSLFAGDSISVVPDTSFYIEHPVKLEQIDFHVLTEVAGSIKVLVPMVVIDELDGLKRSNVARTRWRAGYSLAVMDRLIFDPPRPGLLSEKVPNRGDVTLQIVFDQKGHQRLAINDDEIVDRCVACQPYTPNVTVITYDTGQSTRARTAGLNVKKLSPDLGPDPDANGEGSGLNLAT